SLMNAGILMATGHPWIHFAFLQLMQREASSIASSALYPKHTSSKFVALTFGSCSRIGTFFNTSPILIVTSTISTSAVMCIAFLQSQHCSSFFCSVHLLSLHRFVKVYKMTIKFRTVYACELHFVAYVQTACTAHSSTVNHDRVHADDRWDSQILCHEACEFHHDHRSDCNTDVIMLSFLFYKLLYHGCNHAGMSVASIVCADIDITCYCLHLFFHDYEIFCLCTDDDICVNAVLMQPFY